MKKFDEPEIRESFVCPNVPEAEGIYVITDGDDHVLCVGSSKRLRRRNAYILGNLYDSERSGYLDDASEPLLALQANGETPWLCWAKRHRSSGRCQLRSIFTSPIRTAFISVL